MDAIKKIPEWGWAAIAGAVVLVVYLYNSNNSTGTTATVASPYTTDNGALTSGDQTPINVTLTPTPVTIQSSGEAVGNAAPVSAPALVKTLAKGMTAYTSTALTSSSGSTLSRSTKVQVLSFTPGHSSKIKILSGAHAGETTWVKSDQLKAA